MSYQKLITSNIKALRQIKQLTQEQFAEKIGISINGLSNIERNRYQPNAETIDRICKEFNITPVELLTIKSSANKNLIKDIINLLSGCSTQKLKQIYSIVRILIKKY